MRSLPLLPVAAALACITTAIPMTIVPADEGMWLLNDPPRQLLKDKYQFDLTDDWLERARLASVRFNNGGSGGFVSADGLIVTNHHIGADALQKLSPKDKDYLQRRLLCPQPRRGAEVSRPGAERPPVDRRRDATRQCGRQAGHAAGQGLRRPPGRHGRDREGIAATRPASAATWSRSTRAGSITCIATRNTPTSASCSPRSTASPSSAATWTTSSIRVSASTCAFFRAYEDGKPVEAAALLQVEQDRTGRERPRVRDRPSRHDESARNAGQAPAPPRRDAALHPLSPADDGGDLARSSRRAARSRRKWRPRTCIASPMPARRLPASIRACSTRAILRRKADAEEDLARKHRPARSPVEELKRTATPGADRRGGKDSAGVRARLLPAGARRRLRLRAVPHRPASGAAGGGEAEAERRAAARVPRFGPGIAGVSALLAGADPRRTGARQLAEFADLPRREPGRRASAGGQGAGRQVAGRSCDGTGRRQQAASTPPSARRLAKDGTRPSTLPAIR